MDKLAEFKEKYPDICAAILEEGSKAGKAEGIAEGEVAGIEKGNVKGREEGLKDGAQAERERIQGIEDLAIPGHKALIQTMKFDGETTPAAAAIKLVQAENAVRQTAATALAADGIDPVTHVAIDGAGDGDGAGNLPEGPEKWKAEYEADAKLQKEFKSVETYTAFRQGVSEGRVKILGKKVK